MKNYVGLGFTLALVAAGQAAAMTAVRPSFGAEGGRNWVRAVGAKGFGTDGNNVTAGGYAGADIGLTTIIGRTVTGLNFGLLQRRLNIRDQAVRPDGKPHEINAMALQLGTAYNVTDFLDLGVLARGTRSVGTVPEGIIEQSGRRNTLAVHPEIGMTAQLGSLPLRFVAVLPSVDLLAPRSTWTAGLRAEFVPSEAGSVAGLARIEDRRERENQVAAAEKARADADAARIAAERNAATANATAADAQQSAAAAEAERQAQAERAANAEKALAGANTEVATAKVRQAIDEFNAASRGLPLNTSTLPAQADAKLQELAKTLTANNNAWNGLVVEGHANAGGSAVANEKASAARANLVLGRLAQLGVDARKVQASAKGTSEPLPSISPRAPAQRRVEAEIIVR